MLASIKLYRERILGFLKESLRSHPVHGDPGMKWGRDATARLASFTAKGKAIRGSLALYVAETLGGGESEDALKLAAALELMQSGLLIHDDIMDRDRSRRGSPTVFYQYAADANRYGIVDAYHYGESMGICAGDIAFYIAFGMVSTLDTHPKRLRRILDTFSLEYARVAAAQMADVHYGGSRDPIARKEILAVYKYKTARYTFSMPMALGAILAGADDRTVASLEDFGESLGVLFQLKDDELGMFGDPDKLGKPVGSDIREGKKTLLYAILLEETPEDLRSRVMSIYGKQDATDTEVRGIRDWIVRSGALRKHEIAMRRWAKKAENRLEDFERYPKLAKDLRGWIDYSLDRKY